MERAWVNSLIDNVPLFPSECLTSADGNACMHQEIYLPAFEIKQRKKSLLFLSGKEEKGCLFSNQGC